MKNSFITIADFYNDLQSITQNDSADKNSTITFQNVKTESISVGGTDFRYRKLGEDNAIHAVGLQAPQDLSVIKQPVLVANGDSDRMVPSSNTYDLSKRISSSEIIV